MRAALWLTLLSLLATAPLASAQAPSPDGVVAAACQAVGGVDPDVRDQLPPCPRYEPTAPRQAKEGEHEHAAEPAGDDAPEDAQQAAQEALDEAQQIPEDPQSAPDRVATIAADLLRFVKDLIGLPRDALDLANERWVDAMDALEIAASDAGVRAKDAAGAATALAGKAAARAAELVRALAAPNPLAAAEASDPAGEEIRGVRGRGALEDAIQRVTGAGVTA